MDRMRHTYARQDSSTSSTGSPMGSPSPSMHRHTRSGSSAVGVRRTQQTKAAAVRLAQVMNKQPGDSDDEEDDLDLYDYNPVSASPGLGLSGSRPAAKSRSPLLSARASTDQAGAGRFGSGLRSSNSAGSAAQEQTSSRYSLGGRTSNTGSVEKEQTSSRYSLGGRSSNAGYVEEEQTSSRISLGGRPSNVSSVEKEQTSSRYSLGGRSSNAGYVEDVEEEQTSSPISLGGRPSNASSVEKEQTSSRYSLGGRSSNAGSVEKEKTPSRYSFFGGRSSNASYVEEEQTSSTISLGGRPSNANSVEKEQTSSRYSLGGRPSKASSVGMISPARSVGMTAPARSGLANRPSQPTTTAEPVVSSYARYSASPAVVKTTPAYSVPGNRSFRSTNTEEPVMSPSGRSTASVEQVQPPSPHDSSPESMEPVQISKPMASLRSFRSNSMEKHSASQISLGRPSVGLRPVKMVPSVVPVKLKPAASETQPDTRKEKKLEFGTSKYKDTGVQPTASSDIQDELDVLQEENASLLEKLRLAEERREEAEVRARQLEQQAATQNSGGKGREVAVAVLRTEAETAREEAATASAQLSDVLAEYKSLQSMTQRMILTHEEMEEVVLKRCWLARYWSLCVRHGIHAEIAAGRYEYWSAFAPLPVEVVLAAAERAKEDCGASNDAEERERKSQKRDAFSGEGNVENMLLVDKGLKELTFLKVEEALVIAMAQKRRAVSATSAQIDELKLPIEGRNYSEGFELTEEEQEDVTFKQAWLAYFWRRVKKHGLEPDIADERLQYWIDRMQRLPISNDAVDAERGLTELKKLAVEIKLWEISRLSVDPDSDKKTLLDFDS